jgi:hypothetical protein
MSSATTLVSKVTTPIVTTVLNDDVDDVDDPDDNDDDSSVRL